ncbi:MAG: hypothetical protein OXJ56_18765 [Rhodospirillaceae bacterium]|nr:hypothetical protein [Rhodospirillaceae bacterium]
MAQQGVAVDEDFVVAGLSIGELIEQEKAECSSGSLSKFFIDASAETLSGPGKRVEATG